MGYLTVNDVRRDRLESDAHALQDARGMGSIFSKIFGGGDNVSKYTAKGDSPSKIFNDWKPDLDKHANTLSRIPTGSQKGRLTDQRDGLYRTEYALEPLMAAGATPGSESMKTLNDWIGGIKTFGTAVNALAKIYGILPAAPGSPAPADVKKSMKKAGILGNISPMLIVLGIGTAFLFKMFSKKGRRR